MRILISEWLRILAYDVKRDPSYVLLERALKAINESNFRQAFGFLQQALNPIKAKTEFYVGQPQLKDIYIKIQDAHKSAFDIVKSLMAGKGQEKFQDAVKALSEALEQMKKAEPLIKKIVYPSI